MEYRIRPATVDDADAIARVHVESWRTTYAGIVSQAYLDTLSIEARARNWRSHLASVDPVIFVGEDATGLFGFACGGKQRDESLACDGELYAIYLMEPAQGQGIGRALVRAVAEGLSSPAAATSKGCLSGSSNKTPPLRSTRHWEESGSRKSQSRLPARSSLN